MADIRVVFHQTVYWIMTEACVFAGAHSELVSNKNRMTQMRTHNDVKALSTHKNDSYANYHGAENTTTTAAATTIIIER